MTTTAAGIRQDGLGAIVDRLVPGPGTTLDRVSRNVQAAVARVRDSRVGRPAAAVLRGNDWLGHPVHPILVAVPIGAWVTSAVYDVKSAISGAERDQQVADAALRVGIVAAAPAALTGLVQFLDTVDQARRQTLVHWGLNNVGIALFLVSLGLRRAGRRTPGRAVSLAGLAVIGASGFLGGDLAYRLGVGVRLWPAGP